MHKVDKKELKNFAESLAISLGAKVETITDSYFHITKGRFLKELLAEVTFDLETTGDESPILRIKKKYSKKTLPIVENYKKLKHLKQVILT